ncbi:MAG: ABC transporter substrate-binding protein [Ignavibacteriales bacterium]|nr:ABC transporter substrate-binding protein [Ignavibacteriales bacterium]
MHSEYPKRVVCLAPDAAETVRLLGAADRVVGASDVAAKALGDGANVVAGFDDADFGEIRKLNPDVVFGYGDAHAELLADLARAGFETHVFNQRSVVGVFRQILLVGGMLGLEADAQALVSVLERRMMGIAEKSAKLPTHPNVFVEEWDDPIIVAEPWVGELVEIAGGKDAFNRFRHTVDPSERVVETKDVVEENPDVVVVAWRGKPYDGAAIQRREGWGEIEAIKRGRVFEIDADTLLQPGPAALNQGLAALVEIVEKSVT